MWCVSCSVAEIFSIPVLFSLRVNFFSQVSDSMVLHELLSSIFSFSNSSMQNLDQHSQQHKLSAQIDYLRYWNYWATTGFKSNDWVSYTLADLDPVLQTTKMWRSCRLKTDITLYFGYLQRRVHLQHPGALSQALSTWLSIVGLTQHSPSPWPAQGSH